MQKRQLDKLNRSYSSGSPETILSNSQKGLVELERDESRLRDSLLIQAQQFNEERERWGGDSRRVEPVRPRPHRIWQQVRDGTFYFWVAVGLTVIELSVFSLIAAAFGVNPVFSIALALPLTLGAKAAILAVFGNPDQPLLAKRNMIRFAVIPSAVLLLSAGAALAFVRLATGDIALMLAAVATLSLFSLSIGSLGLAAALFAISHLLLWSRACEIRFLKTEAELAATERELCVVRNLISRVAHPDHSPGLPTAWRVRGLLK